MIKMHSLSVKQPAIDHQQFNMHLLAKTMCSSGHVREKTNKMLS